MVYAPRGGTVIEKEVRPGQYVKEGDSLYTIADLDRVWLVLEVYESELSWVRLGQSVEVKLESEPHRPLTGTVAFIEPVLTDASRSVRVRVIVDNQQSRLKPGMYAQALVRVPIMPGGQPAPTGLEGKYVCPMHPNEISDGPGLCQQCNMPLERIPMTMEAPDAASTVAMPAAASSSGLDSAAGGPKVLAVPADAVLTTGQRQLVYVEREPGRYELVEPKLGPRAGNYYPVMSGLNAGDRVVTRGNFLLDSQYQITGRTSLLYPGRLDRRSWRPRSGDGLYGQGAGQPGQALSARPCLGREADDLSDYRGEAGFDGQALQDGGERTNAFPVLPGL